MVDVDGETAEVIASDLLKHKFDRIRLKSKTITSGDIELIYEVRLKDNDTTFINKLSALKGVRNATLVSYNGDYTA